MKIDKFMSLVRHEGDHWLWTGPVQMRGDIAYPIVNQTKMSARRYIWAELVGTPEKGYKTFPVCGAELCINPAHLVHAKNRTLENRFWRWVEKTSRCWLWKGSCRNQFGYGQIGVGQKMAPALTHRVSWTLHFGEIPANTLVLHCCDNPPCVNPAHLFLGTHKDNCEDKLKKGRSSLTKYSQETVDLIRELSAKGIETKEIAKRTGVSSRYANRIIRDEVRIVRQPTKASDRAA